MRNIDTFCVIVNHLCPEHGPETLVLGPFVSRESADAFMARGLAQNPDDDARVEPMVLNARNLTDVLMLGIDGPII